VTITHDTIFIKVSKMKTEEKIEQLRKRRKELQSLSAQVQDVLDWFEKHQEALNCDIDESAMPSAIDALDCTVLEIGFALKDLEIEKANEDDDYVA
jgi:hypothetical protein